MNPATFKRNSNKVLHEQDCAELMKCPGVTQPLNQWVLETGTSPQDAEQVADTDKLKGMHPNRNSGGSQHLHKGSNKRLTWSWRSSEQKLEAPVSDVFQNITEKLFHQHLLVHLLNLWFTCRPFGTTTNYSVIMQTFDRMLSNRNGVFGAHVSKLMLQLWSSEGTLPHFLCCNRKWGSVGWRSWLWAVWSLGLTLDLELCKYSWEQSPPPAKCSGLLVCSPASFWNV